MNFSYFQLMIRVIFFDDTNKKVMRKIKDEIGGKPIRAFIALKPKLYSIVQNPNLSQPTFHPYSSVFTEKVTITTNLPHSPLNLWQ